MQNTRHANVFMDASGDWWAVFPGVRPRLVEGKWIESQLGMWCGTINHEWKVTARRLGRETYLVNIDWDDDWPVFNKPHNITVQTEGKRSHQLDHNPAWQANLNQGTLELGWYYKRGFYFHYLAFNISYSDTLRYTFKARMVVVCETWTSPHSWWQLLLFSLRVSYNAPP